MARSTVLDEIRGLDPKTECQRIVFLSTCVDFPFDTTRALEFALFRTFAVPSVAALLDSTGEFLVRSQKRYDDTDIIVSELVEHGYDSDRGRRALRRMNQLHKRFVISNDDFLYVLSTFIFEPIRWNERFGWRPLCEQERAAYFHFWREVGRRMNIKQIPAEFRTYEQFNRDYEKANFCHTPATHRVGLATRELFVSWFPRLLAPIVRSAIHALMDEPLLDAFGFSKSSRLMRWILNSGMQARALLLGIAPRRRKPRLRTETKHASYPAGYTIEQLGPEKTSDQSLG
jgi:hypothetical protein